MSDTEVASRRAAVDRLLAAPFAEREDRDGAEWSGPGFRLADLMESRDFWEVHDPDVVDAEECRMEAAFDVLAADLTAAWGAPATVELWLHVETDLPDPAAPGPLGFLAGVASELRVWQPSADRWLGLTVGQAAPELPFRLLALVGSGAFPEPSTT
ncbi:hypothetical protein OG689_12270 [Kitasatospora sp. NBC_00240]|uniref:hypothetical protein n=1 Tax=Kitasatospora sp. NBC_00240 TaxID=2903567 RepID=UPI00224DF1DB|nr:hypothetical protein [Kitasatospora sp. NBC_00240]MCX5210059.1 hypothetical protein [Kitasatospora sp. NBC_00240]